MIPLETVFVGLVILFGIIGALRGWAKELLVSFSVILARFIEYVFLVEVPKLVEVPFQAMATDPARAKSWFYIRMIVFTVIVAFGYATAVISRALGERARKEKFQDTLLGFFLGAINGYLVIGMVWGFLERLNYNIWGITAPAKPNVINFIEFLPLSWLEGPMLFVAVAVSFAFVLIVFV
ncbi:MAG: CvpA family protein [Anaerolineae bacterium]